MIDDFCGKYEFLSNFYKLPDGTTIEHLFQAEKTNDPIWKQKILKAPTSGQAKRLGRQCPIRSDWEEVKDDIMYMKLKTRKFSYPQLLRMLLETGNQELIEGNTWHDNYWGNCTCYKCRNIPGKNMLGKTLMRLRDESKEQESDKETELDELQKSRG